MDAFDYTDYDLSFMPSHHTGRALDPEQVMASFMEEEQRCLNELTAIYEHELDVSYGPQLCDIWYPKGLQLPASSPHVHLFVHGGYWYECRPRMFPSVCSPLLAAGMIVVMVGYDYASKIPLNEVVDQVVAAIHWAQQKFQPAVLTVSGHSAGGQLVAKALENPSVQRSVRAAVLITTVFHVEALVDSWLSRIIKLDTALARQMNVDQDTLVNYRGSLLVVGVEHEAPALQQQNDAFGGQLDPKRRNWHYCKFRDEDHFSIISNLHNSRSKFARVFIKFLMDTSIATL